VRNEILHKARRYINISRYFPPGVDVKPSFNTTSTHPAILSPMPSLIDRFITWCLAKPVPPQMRANLLKITPPEDQELVIKMMDEPWNITDEEQTKLNEITAARHKNAIEPIIEDAKSRVGARPWLLLLWC
jgi:hypothetical protein